MDIKKLQQQSKTKNMVREWEDCTTSFRKGYLLYESGLTSNDHKERERAVKGFARYCEAIAGVKLSTKRLKNIAYQSKKATGHRMKINKFGGNFGKKQNPEKLIGDIYVK